ncbi:hypothetical protein [Algoriphagus alkaliphilus]|nr:hypothetical protein [Algoriphagus alkaliphilus]
MSRSAMTPQPTYILITARQAKCPDLMFVEDEKNAAAQQGSVKSIRPIPTPR